DLFDVLLVRPSGGDENHLVEVEGRLDLAGRDEVAVVDGIEGAAMTPTLRLWSAISVAVRNALPRPSHNAHREEDRQGDESEPDRIHRQLGVGCMLRTLGGGHDGCVHVIT